MFESFSLKITLTAILLNKTSAHTRPIPPAILREVANRKVSAFLHIQDELLGRGFIALTLTVEFKSISPVFITSL